MISKLDYLLARQKTLRTAKAAYQGMGLTRKTSPELDDVVIQLGRVNAAIKAIKAEKAAIARGEEIIKPDINNLKFNKNKKLITKGKDIKW
ncbi:hypothetical protein ABXV22_07065 [Vibrio rotiferianus]|uniref:hypothetical protein n=1 Tax=Vibrio rotiferianus TaxID=190895 RepID=UPI0033998E62